LAERLHKSIEEIEDFPIDHINEWLAYFELKNNG